MNFAFIRMVGLPKYVARRGYFALRRALSKAPMRLRMPTGLDLLLPLESFLALDAFVTHCDLDWGSEALFFNHLEAEGDFVDVGANIGYYSVYGAPCVRRVLSFDPDPRNYAALEANAAQAGNMEIHRAALSEVQGELLLDVSNESSVSKVVENRAAASRVVSVRAMTIDAVAAADPGLKLTGIKLDTEGHELPIMRGGVQTIRRDQPLIVSELQRPPGAGAQEYRELAGFAAELGYALFAFVETSPGLIRGARFKLVELADEATYLRYGTKMIFLVPPRLMSAFAQA